MNTQDLPNNNNSVMSAAVMPRVLLARPPLVVGTALPRIRRRPPTDAPPRPWPPAQAGAAVIRFKQLLLVALLGSVAACGTTSGDRMLSGAGLGAGTGAVVGAVTGIGPGTGAAIGASVGAATGGLTQKKQVNLGEPLWR
ncbi:MAG: YMGG-like glycine zipper-containing protein [Gammaproteobacteria bacterium]